MDYKETVDFLYAQLPYFTRDGKAAIKEDLKNTLLLCDLIDNPQNKFKSIHIAGTNGKGSCSNLLSAVFQEHGYKTGLYTSPHLIDFRERIRINGEMISKDFVVEFVENIKPHLETIKPSFFELTVALCFDYFAKQNIDIAIIETGMGGRMDSTNIITPEVSVITNIGYDHMDLLGNTLQLIASEKAGIIKPNIPVVIGETQTETKQVFEQKASACNTPLFFADSNPLFYNTETECELKGDYQQKNCVTVLQTLKVLETKDFVFNQAKIAKAFMNVKALTGFRGRWEELCKLPNIVADTAHNVDGIKIVINQIKNTKHEQLHIVFGMVKDKKRDDILTLMPKNAYYYFCAPDLMRAMPAKALAEEAMQYGLIGEHYENVKSALTAAKAKANKNDFIYIGGSTFVVAEILE